MTHPVGPTIEALISIFQTAVPEADVLDYFPEEYAKSQAIVIGDVAADVSRDRMAARPRLPFSEDAVITVQIGPSPAVYAPSEARAIILSTLDRMIAAVSADVRLGGVEGLVKCVPQRWVTAFDEESKLLGGLLELNCEYRVNREVP